MEATLPTSAACKTKSCHIPTKRAAIADAHAPSVSVPLRFVVTGLAALYTGLVLLILHPDLLAAYHYGPQIIAVTHLLVLGWLGSLVMGALYQLAPVALETRLYSERLAKIQHALHLIGFAGMVWTFWSWNMTKVGHYGSLLAIGVVLFVYNLARTLARVPRWNVIAFAIASAVFWLFMAICGGLFAVSAKCWPEINPFNPISLMHAHAHLGGIGFFLMMIVGVSYKLAPMFLLSELQSARRAWVSVGLLNLGLLGLFPAILLDSRWKLLFAVVITVGLVIYGLEMRAILRARKRSVLDWGLKSFLAAIACLGPLAAIGLALCWPSLPVTAQWGQLENVYGILAILGVMTFTVLGMLYKIIPFLVWYIAYSKHIGRAKVPALADLYWPLWQAVGFWTYLAGLLGLCFAAFFGHEIAVLSSLAIMALSLAAFAINALRMFSHLLKPRLDHLNLRAPAIPAVNSVA